MEKKLYQKVREMFREDIKLEFDESLDKLKSSVNSIDNIIKGTELEDKLDKIESHLKHQKYWKIAFSIVIVIIILIRSQDPLTDVMDILHLIISIL